MAKMDTWELVYGIFSESEKKEALLLWKKCQAAEEVACNAEDRIKDIPRNTSREDRMAILNHAVYTRQFANFCEDNFDCFLRETAGTHGVEWDGN